MTVSQCVEALPFGRCVWEAFLCALLAWFLLGAINEPSSLAFLAVDLGGGTTGHAAILLSAALALGNFLAVLAGGWLADRHGRTAVMRPALLLTVVSGGVLQMATTIWEAALARLFLGLSSGCLLAITMPLLAEVLPARHRGFYLTAWCSSWPAGAILALIMSSVTPRFGWQAFYSLVLVPALLLYVSIRIGMIPESPRWLYLAGHRDEGFNTLLDMYDKEDMALPWAPESIAVSSAPTAENGGSSSSSDKGSSSSSEVGHKVCLCSAVFLVNSAAQCIRLWLPIANISRDAHRVKMQLEKVSLLSYVSVPWTLAEENYDIILVLLLGYFVQLLGCLAGAALSKHVSRRTLVQGSLLMAATSSLVSLAVKRYGHVVLSGCLLGSQLAMQAVALNFLMAFTCEHFPTSSRAKTVALVSFAGQFGVFATPVATSLFLEKTSPTPLVLCVSAMYIVAWLVSMRLPLPSSLGERSLHDVEEPKSHKSSGIRVRKRDWVSYQTV